MKSFDKYLLFWVFVFFTNLLGAQKWTNYKGNISDYNIIETGNPYVVLGEKDGFIFEINFDTEVIKELFFDNKWLNYSRTKSFKLINNNLHLCREDLNYVIFDLSGNVIHERKLYTSFSNPYPSIINDSLLLIRSYDEYGRFTVYNVYTGKNQEFNTGMQVLGDNNGCVYALDQNKSSISEYSFNGLLNYNLNQYKNEIFSNQFVAFTGSYLIFQKYIDFDFLDKRIYSFKNNKIDSLDLDHLLFDDFFLTNNFTGLILGNKIYDEQEIVRNNASMLIYKLNDSGFAPYTDTIKGIPFASEYIRIVDKDNLCFFDDYSNFGSQLFKYKLGKFSDPIYLYANSNFPEYVEYLFNSDSDHIIITNNGDFAILSSAGFEHYYMEHLLIDFCRRKAIPLPDYGEICAIDVFENELEIIFSEVNNDGMSDSFHFESVFINRSDKTISKIFEHKQSFSKYEDPYINWELEYPFCFGGDERFVHFGNRLFKFNSKGVSDVKDDLGLVDVSLVNICETNEFVALSISDWDNNRSGLKLFNKVSKKFDALLEPSFTTNVNFNCDHLGILWGIYPDGFVKYSSALGFESVPYNFQSMSWSDMDFYPKVNFDQNNNPWVLLHDENNNTQMKLFGYKDGAPFSTTNPVSTESLYFSGSVGNSIYQSSWEGSSGIVCAEYVTDNASASLIGNLNIDLNIFPNPSSNFISVAIPQSLQDFRGDLSLFDINGELVNKIAVVQRNLTIDISTIEPGLYFLCFESVDGFTKSYKKVIVL